MLITLSDYSAIYILNLTLLRKESRQQKGHKDIKQISNIAQRFLKMIKGEEQALAEHCPSYVNNGKVSKFPLGKS